MNLLITTINEFTYHNYQYMTLRPCGAMKCNVHKGRKKKTDIFFGFDRISWLYVQYFYFRLNVLTQWPGRFALFLYEIFGDEVQMEEDNGSTILCFRAFLRLLNRFNLVLFYNLLVCDSRLVYIDAFYTLQKKIDENLKPSETIASFLKVRVLFFLVSIFCCTFLSYRSKRNSFWKSFHRNGISVFLHCLIINLFFCSSKWEIHMRISCSKRHY